MMLVLDDEESSSKYGAWLEQRAAKETTFEPAVNLCAYARCLQCNYMPA